MPYETPITVKTALRRIDEGEYALPAIQREFVWGPDRIARLFDSLMRGYPLGGFLLWRLEQEAVQTIDLFKVMQHYSEFDKRHNEPLELLHPRALHAVLDGQQRLTALNIGLRGSYAWRLPRKWANNAINFPARRLHIELCRPAPASGITDSRYRFEFLRDGEAASRNGVEEHWFRVGDVLGGDPVAHLTALQGAGLTGDALTHSFKTLQRLSAAVETDLVIASHVEEEQDLDRVLDIFIRVNSGGMTLSSSDLLLSIATAHWKERDARQSIHDLVDALNSVGAGFSFNKDQVLKASLVLTNASDVGFKASNINAATMAKVEELWEEISGALRLAASALARFGFNARTLTAHSVAIPLAVWLQQREYDEGWLTQGAFQQERQAVHDWVLRSLLKRGIWGSGLDSLLLGLRNVIRASDATAFPVAEIEKEMAVRGKSLVWSDEEVDALTRERYGSPRAFGVLAIIYPGMHASAAYDVDHVFPRSQFRRKTLRAAGLSDDEVEVAVDLRDELPNLQLLETGMNISKQAQLPHEWIAGHFADSAGRDQWIAGHDLTDLPHGFAGFAAFVQARRERMRHKLSNRLQSVASAGKYAPEVVEGPDDELAPDLD